MENNQGVLEQKIYDFIKNSRFKYVSFSEIFRFMENNNLFNKIKYSFGSNKYIELIKILDSLIEQQKIKKDTYQMVNSYYV